MLQMEKETQLSLTLTELSPGTENQLLSLRHRYGFNATRLILKGVSNRDSDKNHSKQTTLMTDCYSQNFPGIETIMKDGPYGRVCPLTLDTGFLAVNNYDTKWIKPKGENWKGEIIQYDSGYWFHNLVLLQ